MSFHSVINVTSAKCNRNCRICWQRYNFFTVFVSLLHRQLPVSKKLPTYFESKTPKKLRFPVEIYQKSIDIHDLSIYFCIFVI